MKKLKQTLFLGLVLIISFGCNPMGKEKLKVEFKNPSVFKDLKSQVSNISVVNNQLVISGSALTGITTATLKNNSQEEVFQVESVSDSQIIANGVSAINIIAGSVFDLILADAYGSATFQVTFTVTDGAITTAKIANGAVTAAKLDSMGASAGQFLKFNGTTWVAASVLDGQTYMGTWDASSMMLPAVSTPGDYYIVSVAGTFGTPAVTYSAGDWIITDGYNWQKVGFSKAVSSFQGRKGIVTLLPADYLSLKDITTSKITGSSINDLADVDLSVAPSIDGQVLKWNLASGTWKIGTDNAGAGGITLSSLSATTPIVYNNTTGAFSITAATTGADGTLSAADKTKLDGLTAIPTVGDGLVERFSGILAMKTCAAGEILIWYSPTGWTCTTSLLLSGSSAQTLGMSRNSTANTAGNNLSIYASGATTAATDKSGGNLVLSGGTSTGSGTSSIQFQTSTAGATGVADNAPSTKMTILGNGNVGIGTTAPAYKVTIKGSTIGETAMAIYDSNNTIRLRQDYSGTVTAIGTDGNGRLDLGAAGFSGNATIPNAMTLLTSGNVGIGMTPTVRLDVAGAIKTSGQLTSTVTTGTAPFVVASTSQVTNLNASSLGGATFAAPGPIGSTTRSTIAGTTGTFSGAVNISPSSATGQSLIVNSNGIIGTAFAANATGGAGDLTAIRGVTNADDGSYLGTTRAVFADASGVSGDGSITTAIGVDVANQTVGSNNYGIRNQVTSGANKWGYYGSGTAQNYFAGNVGIGNTGPSTLLHVGSATTTAGTAVASFQTATGTCTLTPATSGSGIACSSDERLKKNISEVSGQFALDRIFNLQAVTYEFKKDPFEQRHTGYIAQQVKEVAPEFVRQNNDGFYQIYYDGLVPWITEAIKELYTKIMGHDQVIVSHDRAIASVNAKAAKLEAENIQLKKDNAQVKQENAAIKAYLCGKDRGAAICN